VTVVMAAILPVRPNLTTTKHKLQRLTYYQANGQLFGKAK